MPKDPMIAARLAELAVLAEVAKLKYERGQHWERELKAEVAAIANKARELLEQIDR